MECLPISIEQNKREHTHTQRETHTQTHKNVLGTLALPTAIKAMTPIAAFIIDFTILTNV